MDLPLYTRRKRKSSNDDDNSSAPKQYKIEGADEVICLLHQQLRSNGGDKEEFNRDFAKLIARKNQLNRRQLQWLHESSPNGLNFLMLACKYGNVEAVKFLISCGLNPNNKTKDELTASDYAWENKNLYCLIELLNADAFFPKKFDRKSLEGCNLVLKLNIYKRLDFHKIIEAGELEKVKSFVTKNPKIRFAYNDNNQCALTTALKASQIEIYLFLRGNFFEAGIDSEKHENQLKLLDQTFKGNIRTQLRVNFKKPVIMKLLAKSRDFSGQNYEKIMAFYETLNEIPEISPILELVSKSEETDIVFDFNSEGVFVIDPTVKSNPYGQTYHSGYILIGAKREQNEVLATIAHELTHWAIQLVYKNKCQPFYEDDDDQQKLEFEKITNEIFNDLSEQCSVISEAFEYGPDQWNEELIVRVPQLMAVFKDNQNVLQDHKKHLHWLFEYFENTVLKDIKQEVKLFDQKKEIQNLNEKFGVYKKAKEFNMFSSEFAMQIDISQSLEVKTNLPDLALECIYKMKQKYRIKFLETTNIFVKIEQLLEPENYETLEKAAKSEVRPDFIIVNSENIPGCQKIDEKLAKSLEELKIFYISTTHQTCFENLNCLKIEIDFKWNDLNDQAKVKIMNSKIIFQDSEVKLFEIVGDESFLKEVPLEKLFNLSSLHLKSFEKTLPKRPPAYIKRKFETDQYVFDDLCDFISNQKTVLIADSAGMGKSTSAVQLARDLKAKNKLTWVVFIDLKQHTKVFFPDKQAETEIVFPSFFTEKLLKLKTRFESKLFESFYARKNVIFIIDGFDEISPKYKKFVLNILQAIKNSENYLLVTTRPHFTTELEQRLDTNAISIRFFDKKHQIEFLTKFWNLESNDEFKSRIELFLYKFNTDDFCETPVHIFMLAEVFAGKELKNIDEQSLNLFSLYEKFIEKKLKIWNEEKGNLAKDDSIALQQTFPATNLKQILYRLAVEQIFSADEPEMLKIPEIPDEIIDETIARVGIVAYNNEQADGDESDVDDLFEDDSFDSSNDDYEYDSEDDNDEPKCTAQFTHRTYAEFFVADLIASQAFKKDPKYEFVKLFAELISKPRNFEQIWKFLNDKLEIMEEFDTEALAITFGRAVEQIEDWRELRDQYPMYSSIWKMPSCSKLISFILETLNLDDNSKKKLLLFFWQNFGDRFEYFSIIWPCAQTIPDQTEKLLKELLFTNVRRWDFFEMALNRDIKAIESERASKVVLEYAGRSLKEEDFMKLFFDMEKRNKSIALMINHSKDYFFECWALAEKKLNKKNLKKLAMSKDEYEKRTILHLIAKKNREILKWLQILKTLLTPEEFDEHLLARDFAGYSFITYIVREADLEKLKVCWKFIEENLSLETQKKLLPSKEERGELLIEDSFHFEDESVVGFFFDVTDSVLQKTEGKTLIKWLRDQDRLAYVIHRIVVRSNELFDKYSAIFDAEEFRDLLKSKSSERNSNVFHCFVYHKNSSSIKLWNRIVEKIDDLEAIKVLLFEECESGFEKYCNVFFHAAHLNNPFLIELLEWCKITFNKNFITKIFTEKNEDGRTLLHIVAECGDKNLNLKCLKFVSNNFEVEKQQEMLRMKDKNEEPPIETSCSRINKEVTNIWAEFYEKLFEKEELKRINFSENNRNRSYEYLERKKALENRWKNKSGL